MAAAALASGPAGAQPDPGTSLRWRGAALRQAGLLAAGFVVARLLYRVLFGGASGDGVVLVPLPAIALGGPFSYVTLLGPITAGGLWTAAVSALPVAAVIVGFGVLNALVDLRPWFARAARRGPLRSFSRALVIAWDTFPALALAFRSARRAALLRGERPGPRLLAPVFETTIERALALAAALELRGFAAARLREGACERPVELVDATLERGSWRLSIPALSLPPGELVVVAGPTGSGKSSLLDAVTGLFQHADGGRQQGTVLVGGLPREAVPPRETAGFVGVVAQEVRGSFVAATVAEEIGFSLATRGVAGVIVDDRVREVAARLGITALLGRPVAALSAGEAVLVALAAAVAGNPTVLVVDEPLAELDAAARPRVIDALDRLAHEAGVLVIVAEHRVAALAETADRALAIEDGVLVERPVAALVAEAAASAPQAGSPSSRFWRESAPLSLQKRELGADRRADEAVLEIEGLSVRHGERLAVDGVSLKLRAGELVALLGRNGAGKSSLLNAIALPDAPRGRARPRAGIALVPEAAAELFTTVTVAEECRRADRRARNARATTAELFLRLSGAAPQDLATHPRDLSGGQRLCLAIAIQLAVRPPVLLVDEPARGLDAAARAQLTAALHAVADDGTAVLFATHEPAFAAVAERSLRLEAGRLVASAAPERALA